MKTQVCRVCAIALAVLLGIVSTSAAEPKGPSGLTLEQCNDLLDICGGLCDQSLESCTAGVDVGTAAFNACVDTFHQCSSDCLLNYHDCVPARIRTAGVGILTEGQATILESLQVVSAKLDLLRTQGNLLAQLAAALPVDLVPLPRTAGSTDPLEFCQSTGPNELDVHVSNQGSVPAPASTTHVDFANSGGVDMPTPALAPGASAIVQFAIPATCSLKCSFTIVVDSANVVTESNETNNSVAGFCDLS